MAVTLTRADGTPASGRAVRVTSGAATTTLTTDDDGCAFFSFLRPGTPTVTLDEPGWVDSPAAASPVVRAVPVAVGSTVPIAITYDRAVRLEARLRPVSALFPPPAGLEATLRNSALQPSGTRTVAAGGVVDAFPYTNGYEAWAGCPLADPGAGHRVAVTTPPGGSVVAELPVVPLAVTPQPAADVRVLATGACSASPHVLGTSAGGAPVHASLPAGTWTLSVEGRQPPAVGWPTVTLAPGTTSPTPATVAYQ